MGLLNEGMRMYVGNKYAGLAKADDGKGGGVLFLENALMFSIDLMRSPNAGAVRLLQSVSLAADPRIARDRQIRPCHAARL